MLNHTPRHRIASGQQGFGVTAIAQEGAKIQIVTRKPSARAVHAQANGAHIVDGQVGR